MLVTAIICTRNRAAQLGDVLRSAAAMAVPAGLEWELLVVDNGSSDGTAEVVAGFADRLPIRCVREEVAGLSNARNRGVAEARGRYICWTDDDVVIDPGWLAAYVDAFRRHPHASVFGGRVLPELEAPTPAWFDQIAHTPLVGNILARRDFGDDPVPVDPARIPWGANFALRTAEQRRHRYDPKLGVSPNQNRTGEESQLIRRIVAEGAEGWWVPGAKVRHMIPARRQTTAYVYSYNVAKGESWAYLAEHDAEANFLGPPLAYRRTIAGVPAWAWRVVAHDGLRYALLRRTARADRWLPHLIRYAFHRGAIAYWREHGLPPSA